MSQRRFRLVGKDALAAVQRTKVDPATFAIDRPDLPLEPRSSQWRRKEQARIAIKRMLARAKREPKAGDAWTKAERTALERFASGAIDLAAFDKIVRRSRPAIRHKAREYGLTIPAMQAGQWWTDEELELLRTRPACEVARLTGRPVGAVQFQRYKRGISVPPTKTPTAWTEAEVRDLATPEGRVRLLETRTQRAIEHAMSKRRLKAKKEEAIWSAIRAETGFVRVAHLRAEIEAAAFVLMKDGKVDAKTAVRRSYTDYFGDRFVSLDDTGPDGDGQALIDRIDADTFHF